MNLRGGEQINFCLAFQMFLIVSISFALPHTSSTGEWRWPFHQVNQNFVECDSSNRISNKVNDEPMDMADMFTTDKADKNQVEPSPVLDFSHYINSQDVSEKTKHFLIKNRAPPKDFKCPQKQYKTREGLQESSVDTASWTVYRIWFHSLLISSRWLVLYCMCSVSYRKSKRTTVCAINRVLQELERCEVWPEKSQYCRSTFDG